MKVLYIPFNNRGLGVDTYEESGFVLDALKQMTDTHIDTGDSGVVLLYLSEADSGFNKAFSKRAWPSWLLGINIIVKSTFNQDEGDKLALALANRNSEDVIEFRPYPTGIVSEEEAHRMHCVGRKKWGWSYVVALEDEEQNA